MTEREVRIAFNMIPAVGAVTFERLLREAQGDAVAAWEMYPEKLDWQGKEPDWQREIEQAVKMNVRIITEVDDDYPPLLKTIASPPLALYAVGDTKVLSQPAVALVGTRHCTEYGRDTAEKLAFSLAKRGWCVVSGLASGIDAAAHTGALSADGKTIGVLGSALDKFYPQDTRPLARRMVANGGCVVSEFSFGRSPDAQTFPQRNRIVSGLCQGVVAVEASLHSGTLITCSIANEQGRTVMAVPGRVDWRTSDGCNNLIREGVCLVTSADDIIESLTPLSDFSNSVVKQRGGRGGRGHAGTRAPTKAAGAARTPPLPEVMISAEEASILRLLNAEGVTLDAIVAGCGLPISKVNTLTVGLRLKGKVRLLSGNRVASI